MEKILDFSQPFDLALYNNLVGLMCGAGDPAQVCSLFVSSVMLFRTPFSHFRLNKRGKYLNSLTTIQMHGPVQKILSKVIVQCKQSILVCWH